MDQARFEQAVQHMVHGEGMRRLTPSEVASRLGVKVQDAERMLDRMVTEGTLELDSDDEGNLFYFVPGVGRGGVFTVGSELGPDPTVDDADPAPGAPPNPYVPGRAGAAPSTWTPPAQRGNAGPPPPGSGWSAPPSGGNPWAQGPSGPSGPAAPPGGWQQPRPPQGYGGAPYGQPQPPPPQQPPYNPYAAPPSSPPQGNPWGGPAGPGGPYGAQPPHHASPYGPAPQQPWSAQGTPYGAPAGPPQYPGYGQMHPGYAAPPHAHQALVPGRPGEIRSPATAAILSVFFPGAGQLYNGQIGKGLTFFFLTVLLVSAFQPFMLVPYVWSIIDAYNTSRRINAYGLLPP